MKTETQPQQAEAALRQGHMAPDGMQKRVLAGGSIGQFIEFYDFTLYGLSAVVLSQLFFPGTSALAGLLATFATFGVAFLVRPLGGLFFGALGDKIGRRKVLFITLLSIGCGHRIDRPAAHPRGHRRGCTNPARALPDDPGLLRRRRIRRSPGFRLRARTDQQTRILAEHHPGRHRTALGLRRHADPGALQLHVLGRLHVLGLAHPVPPRPAHGLLRPVDPREDRGIGGLQGRAGQGNRRRNTARCARPSPRTRSACCRSSS